MRALLGPSCNPDTSANDSIKSHHSLRARHCEKSSTCINSIHTATQVAPITILPVFQMIKFRCKYTETLIKAQSHSPGVLQSRDQSRQWGYTAQALHFYVTCRMSWSPCLVWRILAANSLPLILNKTLPFLWCMLQLRFQKTVPTNSIWSVPLPEASVNLSKKSPIDYRNVWEKFFLFQKLA